MRIFLMAIVLMTSIVYLSCGKDGDTPTPPRDTIPTQDTIPVHDTVPNGDTLGVGWKTIALPGDSSAVYDIFFKDSITGYAITANRKIWKSVDGGLSWTMIFQTEASFNAINLSVTGDGKVFVVSGNPAVGVYKSTDGGNSFVFQTIGDIGKYGNADVYFAGNDTGYISAGSDKSNGSDNGGLWKTTDGGGSWSFVKLPKSIDIGNLPVNNGVHSLAFYNGSEGYVTNNYSIDYTAGNYNQWQQSDTIAEQISTISAPAAGIAYAVSTRGHLFKTTDAGVTFSLVASSSLNITTDAYTDVHFVNAQEGFMSWSETVFKTTDGGATWKGLVSSKHPLIEIHFTDAAHGWACGDEGTILVYRP